MPTLPHGPTSPLHRREGVCRCHQTGPPAFSAAFVWTAPSWNQLRCPSTAECMTYCGAFLQVENHLGHHREQSTNSHHSPDESHRLDAEPVKPCAKIPNHRVVVWKLCSVAQLCPPLCDPLDYSPPVSSVRGISSARILESVAVSSSRRPSWHRNRTCVSCTAGWFFTADPPETTCKAISWW